jgi:hypothetical protein
MYQKNFKRFMFFIFAMSVSVQSQALDLCASILSDAFFPLIKTDIKTAIKKENIYLSFETYCNGNSVCVNVQDSSPDVNGNFAFQMFEVDPKTMKIYDITAGIEDEDKIVLKSFSTTSFNKVYKCLIK